MKKIYLSMVLVCSLAGAAQAQLSEGGLPVSMRISKTLDKVDLQEYPAPDFAAIIKQQNADEDNGVAKPYMVSQYVNADITLLNSGAWTYLEDGQKIWRYAVTIPGAKAIDFFYDRFNLPEGVQLYLSNANGKQLLGAYTAKNNSKDGLFTNQPVQGDVIYLEMDVAANVPVSAITFHINRMGAYYRGVGDLTHNFGQQAPNLETIPAKPTNENPGTSTCHIEANCPIPGKPFNFYEIPKNATVRITIIGGNGSGFCSGTLINNTGNTTSGLCKPLLLTASHCDEANNRDDASFSQWQFRFNYQYDSCTGEHFSHPIPEILTGASFKARSNLPSMPANGPQDNSLHLVGDFLLLQLNDNIPNEYNAYLAGWNRDPYIATEEDYDFFIGFHHPNGDVKKKCWGVYIDATGQFNQTTVPATHWYATFTNGGTQPGSSGSGLFDKDGLLIGDLSGGNNTNCGGASNFGYAGLYSKLSYDWTNDYDQNHFSAYAGAQSQLKSWLDPLNTGTMTLGPTQSDCSDMPNVGIKELENMLDRSINVYPNPSNTGIIRAKINFARPADLNVTVYNALGAIQKEFKVSNVLSGDYSFDCSALSNGIYLVNFSIGSAVIGKKVILNR